MIIMNQYDLRSFILTFKGVIKFLQGTTHSKLKACNAKSVKDFDNILITKASHLKPSSLVT